MRTIFVLVLVVFYCKQVGFAVVNAKHDEPNNNNVFIITLDGFRWQELFYGADSSLIHDVAFTPDTSSLKNAFWDSDPEKRRKKLMPFMWNVIAREGQVFGNRKYRNHVNVSNIYAISYPGYNEIFTGRTDATIFSNNKVWNKNVSVLEYLNQKPHFKGKVASFTSWDAFPYIFNKQRSQLHINCSNKLLDTVSGRSVMHAFEHTSGHEDHSTRNDYHTYAAAKEYILKHHPRVVHIGLGGTDSYGHSKKYDKYLYNANLADNVIGWLWQLAQSSPFYKDNTTFIITTDHGRGDKKNTWHKHGFFVKGSSQTWLALIGSGVRKLGEIKQEAQLYQKQVAGTIGYFLNVTSFNKYAMPITYFSHVNDNMTVALQ